MILHLLRMRRNVNRNVFNDLKNLSATAVQTECFRGLISPLVDNASVVLDSNQQKSTFSIDVAKSTVSSRKIDEYVTVSVVQEMP